MTRLISFARAASLFMLLAAPAYASDAALFRLFLLDGTEVVSYGEFARLDDTIIFSMPAGGEVDQPRLHLVTLPAALVDWERTDRYAASLRAQRYAETRGEEDFRRLTDQVAAALSGIALSTDRHRALAIAEEARRTLADWPRTHFGYRQDEVRDIVMVLDEAINALRGQIGAGTFELSLVATAPTVALEPVLGMPPPSDQLGQLLHVAGLVSRASDRVALLHSALVLLDDAGANMAGIDLKAVRRSIERQIREEAAIDSRYARLAERLMRDAGRAAAAAKVSDVERVLARLPREDARLGARRPDVVRALQDSVQVQLDQARELRLLRDRWEMRRSRYRDYQRMVRDQLLLLVKVGPSLDAIRRLDGPAPDKLLDLRAELIGGADRLERLLVAEDLRSTHDLFVSAWRLAENAVNSRQQAVTAGDVDTAWAASSAAAGSLMLLARVQQDLADLLTAPTLDDLQPRTVSHEP